MMSKIYKYSELKEMFKGYDAYLVGGAARLLRHNLQRHRDIDDFGKTPPKDYDVLVVGEPPTLPGLWEYNSFGGKKYLDLNIDVWEDDVGKFLREVPRGKDGIAIHIETGAMLFTEEFFKNTPNIIGRPIRLRTSS